jgi:hypothetical protein
MLVELIAGDVFICCDGVTGLLQQSDEVDVGSNVFSPCRCNNADDAELDDAFDDDLTFGDIFELNNDDDGVRNCCDTLEFCCCDDDLRLSVHVLSS